MTQPASDLTQPTTDTPPATQQQSAGNILVVDDTASNRQLLADLLTGQGYDVRMASDGPTALMLAQAEPPDLVLLDIRMPGMDGYEVCRQLKSQAATHHIPIIFISALDEVVDKVKGLELGGADYITKPFQAEEILARVKAHLSLYKLQKELEQRNEALQHEIAERIQVQEAASYERNLMQILLHNTTDYIYFKDRDRRFVQASNAFCNLFKCNLEEIIGKQDEDLFPPEIAQETANDDRHVIETGTPLVNREEGGLINGEEHWVLTTKLPWYDKNGNIAGLFGISREITERKQAEEALQESEEKFRSLAERSPSMTFIIQDGRIVVYVNQRCVEILGYSKEEFYASDFDFRRLVAPEHLDFINDTLRRRLAGEDISAYEYALITKEGQRIEVLSSAVLIRYQGEPAILKTITDITERKHMEEALQASEARLRAQYNSIPIPTYTWQRLGDDFVLVDYNTAALTMTQGKIADLVGRKASDMYQDRPDIQDDLARCLAEQGSFEREMVYEFRSIGETKHLGIKCAFVPPDLVLVHSEDISDRKQAEQALLASQQFVQSTLDALGAHIAILDETGTILSVNTSWRRFGEENGLVWEDSGVGRNYLTIAEAASGELVEGAAETANRLRAVISGQRDSFWLEYPCNSPDEERWFVLNATRFESSQGLRIVMSHNDITHRVQAENAVHRRVEEISTLHTITQMMAATTDLSATLHKVAEMMTYLFDAEVVSIIVLTVENTQLRILAGSRQNVPPSTTASPATPLIETAMAQQVLAQDHSLILSDIQTRSLSPPIRRYVDELDLQATMLIPLRTHGDVVGILVVGAYQPGRAFTRSEVALAETIAGDIAAVIKNDQLSKQAQMVAVDAERQRLARELHDSVTQSLYSLTLLANGWSTMATQGRLNQQQVVDSFKQLGEIGQQGLKEMRLLIHQLRPPVLEEVGLVSALQQRLDAVEQRVNIETHLYTQGADELPLDVAEQLYNITLEALNNILRHARATIVTINLQETDDCLRLAIQDNGIGFDPTAPSLGLGLTTMQERAQAINANLQITSTPQQGTTVEVTLALGPGDND